MAIRIDTHQVWRHHDSLSPRQQHSASWTGWKILVSIAKNQWTPTPQRPQTISHALLLVTNQNPSAYHIQRYRTQCVHHIGTEQRNQWLAESKQQWNEINKDWNKILPLQKIRRRLERLQIPHP